MPGSVVAFSTAPRALSIACWIRPRTAFTGLRPREPTAEREQHDETDVNVEAVTVPAPRRGGAADAGARVGARRRRAECRRDAYEVSALGRHRRCIGNC